MNRNEKYGSDRLKKAVVIGASGALGAAFVNHLHHRDDVGSIYAFSRSHKVFTLPKVRSYFIDIEEEQTIQHAAQHFADSIAIDIILVATGVLHKDSIVPEKALRDVTADKFQKIFAINTVGPALVAKHFLPLLPKDKRGVFAALSARVGSIGDNQLGGWYAYRASKAALNMIIKTASIEMQRNNKYAIVVSLHPGTVDSQLSKPFQSRIPPEKIFAPVDAAAKLLDVMDQLTPEDTGKFFAWDGAEIEY